jgi:hypothetical protein
VASSFSVDIVVEKAMELGGIAVPAHVDKPIFSIVSQLGFLPDLPFSAVELSSGFVRKNGDSYGLVDKKVRIITASDSHFLDTVGSAGFEIDCEDDDLFGILMERKFCEQSRIFY